MRVASLCLIAACASAPGTYPIEGSLIVQASRGDSVDMIVYELRSGDTIVQSGKLEPGPFAIADVPAGDYTLELLAEHLGPTDNAVPVWQVVGDMAADLVVDGPVDVGQLVLAL